MVRYPDQNMSSESDLELFSYQCNIVSDPRFVNHIFLYKERFY